MPPKVRCYFTTACQIEGTVTSKQGRIQGGGGALGAEAPPSYLGFT